MEDGVPSESTAEPKKMRMLSIDGGGIRGVIPASVLVEVERIIQDRDKDAQLADCFDLFAGTSAGGLISGLLLMPERSDNRSTATPPPEQRRRTEMLPESRCAARKPAMSAQDLLDFYLEYGPGLFKVSPAERIKRLGGLIDERYSSAGFNRALDSRLGKKGSSSEPMLSHLLRPTVITTYNAGNGVPFFFKQHTAVKAGGRDFSLRDVALATSAAPTAFETVDLRSNIDHLGASIDGGLFANNPTMCGYAEAHGYFGHTANDIAILSLGTGVSHQTYEYEKMRNWGAASWVQPIFEMMIAGSSNVVDYQIRQIFHTVGDDVPDHQYLRLQADLSRESESTKKMDNASPANLDRLVDIGRELVHSRRAELEQFIDSQLLGRQIEHVAPMTKVLPVSNKTAPPGAGPTSGTRSEPARPPQDPLAGVDAPEEPGHRQPRRGR